MIIVRILGGLGNQMFQYAYAKALQNKGFDVSIDISKFRHYTLHGGYHLDKFNIDIPISKSFSTGLGKIGIKRNLKEKSLLFNNDFLELRGNEYIKGYFQTEKYFKNIRNLLLEQFSIKQKIADSTKEIKNTILNTKYSCSLHIRRGDYISDKKANNVHGTCSLDYYKEASEIILKKFPETLFFVFSDDIEWVKENLKIENVFIINHKTIPHEDMYLMSLCDNNITANSSFSWWGAWLNQNENKTVISPKKWFVDKENEVACESWLKI